MIPTVLVIGVGFGFIYGVTRKTWIINAGAIAAVVGWLVLVLLFGDSGSGPVIVLGATVVALLNYAVAALIGWSGVIVLRYMFGMTSE
ncbi:MAG: hypothetical protein M3132_08740 [Actinomycetia bacterium]|nr:hypothetical protein [Actinomycetes bacterium]